MPLVRVFNLKRSIARAFRVLSRKSITGDIWQSTLRTKVILSNLLYRNKKFGFSLPCYVRIGIPLRGEKHFKPRPQQQDLDTLQGLSSKFPTSSSVLFKWESPPPLPWTNPANSIISSPLLHVPFFFWLEPKLSRLICYLKTSPLTCGDNQLAR